MIQLINNHTITMHKDEHGASFAKVVDQNGDVRYIPAGMLLYTAGKDAWMRTIMVSCQGCGCLVRVEDTECELCGPCMEIENENIMMMDR